MSDSKLHEHCRPSHPAAWQSTISFESITKVTSTCYSTLESHTAEFQGHLWSNPSRVAGAATGVQKRVLVVAWEAARRLSVRMQLGACAACSTLQGPDFGKHTVLCSGIHVGSNGITRARFTGIRSRKFQNGPTVIVSGSAHAGQTCNSPWIISEGHPTAWSGSIQAMLDTVYVPQSRMSEAPS